MEEAARLGTPARQCRQIAATLSSAQTAETRRDVAREFEATAAATEKLPLIRARPPWRRGA